MYTYADLTALGPSTFRYVTFFHGKTVNLIDTIFRAQLCLSVQLIQDCLIVSFLKEVFLLTLKHCASHKAYQLCHCVTKSQPFVLLKTQHHIHMHTTLLTLT